MALEMHMPPCHGQILNQTLQVTPQELHEEVNPKWKKKTQINKKMVTMMIVIIMTLIHNPKITMKNYL